jgi:fructan beta-fructosidase
MALYLDKNEYALFTSVNLKSWKEIQRINIENASECPDFFEIEQDNDSTQKKWVLAGANGRFLAGRFDGNHFSPETASYPSEWGRNYYAVQSYCLFLCL